MLRLKKLSHPTTLVLAALVLSCIAASSALAGSKAAFGKPWDPTHHAVATNDTIHVYSFRKLVRKSSHLAVSIITGGALLKQRCGSASTRHWCATTVAYELTGVIGCGQGGPAVWAHLYVRTSRQTTWRELGHYHDVVKTDCA